ncbi:retrovirus-related pol polyprotein from transposon TNT 1-94 [Tanacetum coccineum]
MTTLAEHMIVAGADNHPPMLENSMYNSWSSRMLLYIKGMEHGRIMLNSVLEGPLVYSTIEVDGVTRLKTYEELLDKEKLQDDCDLRAMNIVLQGLPADVYSLVNHHQVAKQIWDRVKLLMQGTELTYQEREFDRVTSVKDETLHEYYLRFDQLLNFMHAIRMTMHHTIPSVPQNAYHDPIISQQPQAEFPQLDSGLAVLSFLPGDDPIDYLNKTMAFMSTVMASHFSSTNNQLRTSSNPRNQATIQDGRVTVQQVQERHGQSFAGMGTKGNATSSRGNNAASQARVIKCYNCQGEGHMARQCTQPKRPRNSTWFKEKMLLIQAQGSGRVLEEEQLAFLANPGIAEGQVTQTTTPQNAAFQTDDLDAYDSDCDGISSAKAVLMANLSSYDADVLFEVPQHDTYQNDDMINQSVQETQFFEQSLIDYVPDNNITSDSNIISYEQLQETQHVIVHDTNYSAQQDAIIMSFLRDTRNEYKFFEERQNADLNSHEKFIDSQMNDLILNINAKFASFEEQIDTLKQTLSKNSKDNESPINKIELNKLFGDFGKRFVPQNQLSTEQAFWLPISNPKSEQLVVSHSPIEIEVPKELPKESFKDFDNGLHSEINEVKTVFNKMEDAVEQCSVDKKCFDIQKKELFLENDRLLEHIICQDVMNIVMHADFVPVNVLPGYNNNCLVHDNLEIERLEPKNDHLFELLLSQDIVHIYVNSLATITNCHEMKQRMKSSTSISRSQPSSNTKKNRTSQTTSSNMKNKVEEHPRSIKSISNKMNRVIEPVCNANVKHSMLNTKSELICATYNECMFDAIHDLCVLDFVNDVNVRSKSKFSKSRKKKKIWKPTGKIFTSVGYRLSYLNFDYITTLAKKGLVQGLPRLKFQKDHLCSACALGKSKKHSHKPKAEDSIQEKLYLLHMDLCWPMRIQIRLNATVQNIRIDNGTEFVNQTLRAYYEDAPLFLWAEVVATACYTQNRSLIRKRHNKTPYELLHDKKPDLSYLYVFSALCYPTNDSEDLDKLKPKADIIIFVGYAPAKKAYRIYNKRTRLIIETIYVDFDELTVMAFE